MRREGPLSGMCTRWCSRDASRNSIIITLSAFFCPSNSIGATMPEMARRTDTPSHLVPGYRYLHAVRCTRPPRPHFGNRRGHRTPSPTTCAVEVHRAPARHDCGRASTRRARAARAPATRQHPGVLWLTDRPRLRACGRSILIFCLGAASGCEEIRWLSRLSQRTRARSSTRRRTTATYATLRSSSHGSVRMPPHAVPSPSHSPGGTRTGARQPCMWRASLATWRL